MTLLVRLLAAPAWLRWALAAIALLILAALLWTLWLRSHDAKVIDTHEAAISSDVAKATNAANDTANINDAKRQADNAAASQQTKDAMSHAEETHPEAAHAPSGPVTRASLDSLRNRASKAGAAAK